MMYDVCVSLYDGVCVYVRMCMHECVTVCFYTHPDKYLRWSNVTYG